MGNQDKIIVVFGATGQQGGAAARHIAQKGFAVRAITRHPEGDKAQALTKAGMAVVAADLNDENSLRKALVGAYGVFSIQTMMEGGVEAEERQGKLLARVAKDAGIRHFVYSSVESAEIGTGIPHFESKGRIEKEIEALGLPATILRPVFFMDNLTAEGFFPRLMMGMMKAVLHKDTKLQMIAVDDIGRMAAQAFERPEDYLGRQVDLAGDEVSLVELARIWKDVTGNRLKSVPMFRFLIKKMSMDLYLMLDWFEKTGYSVDIPSLRRELPGLKDLRSWLGEQRKAG